VTIFFPDLSHYKVPSLTGAVALITKATQGTSFVDLAYAGFQQQASKLGIPFAGYHWIDTSDLSAQAVNAYRIMGNTPCMWDAEAAGATVPRLVDLTKRYRALGGNPRMVYLPHWWWQDHLGSPSLQPLADLGLALVSSAYPAAGYTETGVGWNSYGGVSPTIWQYTDKQMFNGVAVDFNAFKGTVDQLRTLWGLPEDDMASEWHGGNESGPFLTQGNPGYAKQQRDTALAFCWEAAHEAMVAARAAVAKCDEILAALGQGGAGGGLSFEQTVEAARQGAEKAEDS
jgi:hypothetical protein